MKHLILLRHAKSSWVNPNLEDFDRPLNKRGKRGAKALGDWLRAENWHPDQVLCSSARRTRETWDGLRLQGEPELRDDLYHATADIMLNALRRAAGETVMLISHNPGIGSLAHMIVNEPPQHVRFNDYPTGSLLIARFDQSSAAETKQHSGTPVAFLTPHDLVPFDN